MHFPGPRLATILAPGLNNFGLIRLAAAICVVISHAYLVATGSRAAEPLATSTAFTLGQHGVNVFFIVSGLLVTASLERCSGTADFLMRRVLRIFPGLIVCVLVTVLLVGAAATVLPLRAYFSDTGTLAYMVKTLSLASGSAGLPGVFLDVPRPVEANASVWTLKYEMLCYVGLAGLGLFGLTRGRPFAAVCAATLVLVVTLAIAAPDLAETHSLIDHGLQFVTCFLIGAMAYRLRYRLKLSWIALPCLATFLLAASDTPLERLATYAFTAYAVLWLAALPLGALRGATDSIDLSYGIYLYGWPIEQILIDEWPTLAAPTIAAIALPIAAALAVLSWTYVEKPALSLKSQFGQLRRSSYQHS